MSARKAKTLRAREEIEADIRSFSPGQWARLYGVAHSYAWGTGWTFKDLLQEAFLRTLEGERNCPVDVETTHHLIEAMRSIADGERNKVHNQAKHVAIVQPGELVLNAEDPAMPDPSSEAVLIDHADKDETRRIVLAQFDDDPVARDLVDGIMADLTTHDLKELSGLDGKDYSSKRRLIRRRLDKNFPDGRKA